MPYRKLEEFQKSKFKKPISKIWNLTAWKGGMCNLEKLHFSWSKVSSFRCFGKLLFGNCVWWRKKKDFPVQEKGDDSVLPLCIEGRCWKWEQSIGFRGIGPGPRGKEIILDPEETWRSWNLAWTEFSKERLSCFHKYLWAFRDEELLLPPPCFSSLRGFWRTFHPENCQIVLASGSPTHPGCVCVCGQYVSYI